MTSVVVGAMANPSRGVGVGVANENGTQFVELLSGTNDEHGGVIVDLKEAMESDAFATLLRASMSQWRRQVHQSTLLRFWL